jgi:hypothetical protein
VSFVGAENLLLFTGSKEEYAIHMAKQEIKKRTANLVSVCQWRFWLRTEVEVKWPSGWTPQDHLGNSTQTADPNEWYREWLETNVGCQGWAWDWRIGKIDWPDKSIVGMKDTLRIKFRDAKSATAFALRWA